MERVTFDECEQVTFYEGSSGDVVMEIRIGKAMGIYALDLGIFVSKETYAEPKGIYDVSGTWIFAYTEGIAFEQETLEPVEAKHGALEMDTAFQEIQDAYGV